MFYGSIFMASDCSLSESVQMSNGIMAIHISDNGGIVEFGIWSVDTYYVDATWLGSTRFSSTRLASAQARRHDIPPSCASEFDTRSTKRHKPIPAATSS
ncbi:hypothetical protein Hanom_Chr12g01081911 [Helianthus anomalus]